MNTITIPSKTFTHHEGPVATKTAATKEKSMSPFWSELEFSRYGFIAMALIIVGCLGGAAAAQAVEQNVYLLSAVVFSTMAFEILILAVGSMRTIVYLASIAILVDLFVFFY